MTQTPDNVTPLKTSNEGGESVAAPVEPRPQKDLSRIAIVISLLSLVLSVIFFFGINRNLSGLSHEVNDIGVIRSNVEALDSYVDGLLEQMARVNTRVMDLEELPRKEAVRVLHESMVNDMLRRTEYMTTQLMEVDPDDAETARKLAALQALLLELRPTDASEDAESVSPLATEPSVEPAPIVDAPVEAPVDAPINSETPQPSTEEVLQSVQETLDHSDQVLPVDESLTVVPDVDVPQFVPAPEGQSLQ